MSGLYRLLNAEFGRWMAFVALLCAGAVLVPLLLLNSAAGDAGSFANHARYEDLYAASGCPLLFLLLLALLCAYFLKSVYAGYWGSKSVYTYLTLPVRRESLYFSKLIVFATCLLLLIAAQIVSIRLGYELVAAKAKAYPAGSLAMRNGLFLAFARSEFFRLLLPLNFSRILSSCSMLLAIATGFYYGALCERSRKFGGFALIAVAAFVLYRAVSFRLDEVAYTTLPRSLYPSSLALLAFSGWFVWHSLRIMRKGSIA
ncbi:hypothetical protein [Cohnella zeiphila]|uniref:Uncharacterized protein n=1 Tax=Cohnella zeiphila TaxID=2761120 RepID=A0A7X0W0P8_9BACL|nr:hypothetical protein [Cohnella zeiphila]MBB6735293.1 hypothetical protein [Cohnella zeiphila]